MVSTVSHVPRHVDELDDDEKPGLISRWFLRDRVRAVAVLLIVVQLIWRVYVGSRGFLSFDDFYIAILSVDGKLTPDFLLSQVNNHMFPAPKLFTRVVTENLGFTFWPYLSLMIVCQAILSVSFYRLLRALLPASWGLLIPLSIFLFSPLNLETTSWWSFGMLMLPMQMAIVWMASGMLKYSRTRHWRHVVSIPLAAMFALACAPKALLVIPFLFGFTACVLVRGSVGRSIWRTLKNFWRVWLALLVATGLYLAAYLGAAQSGLRQPTSDDQVIAFFAQIFGKTLIPGLLGGPWNWFGFGGAPLTAPTSELQMFSTVAVVAVIVFTIWRRPAAGRAWVLAFGYALLATGLIAATRMGGGWSDLAGLVTRYASDIVLVTALCLGVAMFGTKDLPDRRPARQFAWFQTSPGRAIVGVAAGLAAIVLGYGTIVTTSGFSQSWAIQPGRDYLRTAQAEIAKMPKGTMFLDAPVPTNVMAAFTAPHNMQSRFFAAHTTLAKQPVFVTEGDTVKVFDHTGKIRPAWVEGIGTEKGPDGDCGYFVNGGKTMQLPLAARVFDWPWMARVAYNSQGNTTMTVRLGQAVHVFKVKNGLNQMFFPVLGGGSAVEVSLSDPSVGVCVNSVTVGNLAPWML